MNTVDFSETIAASDLKVGRLRQLIELMKVCEYGWLRYFLPYIFQVLYVLCFTRPRYQVSVFMTIGPLVDKMAAMRTLTFFRLVSTKRGYACSMIVHTRADQLLPQLLMELFDTLYTQCSLVHKSLLLTK